MKKILFLLLVCLIKLNAYEYLIATLYSRTEYFYYDENNILYTKSVDIPTGVIINGGVVPSYTGLGRIGYNTDYINKNTFDSYLKNDLNFLNDWYVQQTNKILNYFYNHNQFSNNSYIEYTNYELLYNEDGLAVESCVDGVYAGLYSMDEMQFSGNLYNEKGDLVLVNGVEPSYLQMLCDKLIGDLHLKMLDAENLIDKGWIFSIALTFAMFYLIARTLKRVLIGKNNKGVSDES